MLDFDLAVLYEVETRVLKQAVKRNIDIFPEDFMFELTSIEWKLQTSQFVIFEKGQWKGKYPKYLPFAFTEHGVTMLAYTQFAV
jgi:ORF6N domain